MDNLEADMNQHEASHPGQSKVIQPGCTEQSCPSSENCVEEPCTQKKHKTHNEPDKKSKGTNKHWDKKRVIPVADKKSFVPRPVTLKEKPI